MAAPTQPGAGTGGSGGTDERVKISITDTTAGFLSTSLVVHVDTPITLNILSPGADETLELDLDGDQIDIDWVPTNYVRNSSPAEAADLKDLTAHLKGIDDSIGLNDVTPRLGLEKLFNVAFDDHYAEFSYMGNNLITIDIWEDSGMSTKLFTRTLTYTSNNLTGVVTTDEQTFEVLTSTLTYTGNNLDTVTKVVS